MDDVYDGEEAHGIRHAIWSNVETYVWAPALGLCHVGTLFVRDGVSPPTKSKNVATDRAKVGEPATPRPREQRALMAKQPKLYRWTIYLIRNSGELLGAVEAPDEKAAIAAATE